MSTSAKTPNLNLRNQIKSILEYKKNHSLDEMRTKYSTFVTTYPKFFEKLMQDNINEDEIKHMNYIIGMYEKVQKNKTSFDDASKQIGQRMFDHYVKPDLPPPSDTAQGIKFGGSEASTI